MHLAVRVCAEGGGGRTVMATIGRMLLSARRIPGKAGPMQWIILAMRDVTGSPPAEDAGGRAKENG